MIQKYDEIDEMVVRLLEMGLEKDHEKSMFTNEERDLIHSIAKRCKEIPMVIKTKEMGEKYAEGMTSEDIYMDMLYKIVAAPTRIHMLMTVRTMILIIDRKLWGEELGSRLQEEGAIN